MREFRGNVLARLGAIAVLVTIVAPVPAYACTHSGRCHMRASAHPVPIKPAARADWSDVRACFHATITNARTGAYD
jgi:hypothetical protein